MVSEVSAFGFCLLETHGSFARGVQSSLCLAARPVLSVLFLDAHLAVKGGAVDTVGRI